jgi:hypothetical protein
MGEEVMNQTRDKFLTEAMGGCWHTYADNPDVYFHFTKMCQEAECVVCRDIVPLESKEALSAPEPTQNDFSTWPGFGKLWEWAQQQEWKVQFAKYLGCSYCVSSDPAQTGISSLRVEFIHPDRFANAVYEFLKERTEK